MAILSRSFLTIARCAGLGFAVAGGLTAVKLSSATRAEAQLRAPADSASLEYEVKAAYLLNFTRYVDWPLSAFPRQDSPLVICVIGPDPFHAILERTVEGRAADGHPIAVQRAALASDARGCHMAFLASGSQDLRIPQFDQLEGAVLTIGEGRGFARRGGMIGLVIVNATVRFEFNLDAVRGAGLQVSSRLLALATRVYSRVRANNGAFP